MEAAAIKHVWWRAGFGIDITDLADWQQKTRAQLVQFMFEQSKKFTPLDIAEKPERPLFMKGKGLNKGERSALRKINFEELQDLNITQMHHLAFSPAQLRERMFMFWHDHFACFVPYSYMMQMHVNTLKKHALGNFKTLLTAVAQDAAMLEFLNNLQNKKRKPNENFARELLELYTLGIGHYTENDIKEAARAFTGWAYDEDGTFIVRAEHHDEGVKTFLGETGNWDGHDILRIILAQKRTAEFICEKLYAFLVNDTPNQQHIQELTDVFWKSDYDIQKVLEHVFMADWFYDKAHMGARIKSPADLITGMRRQFGIEFKDDTPLLFLQKILGQTVGYPPNVAGWADGKGWIDSSTLIFRLRLGDIMFAKAPLDIAEKELPETKKLGKQLEKLEPTIMLDHIWKLVDGQTPEQMAVTLTTHLLETRPETAKQLRIPTHLTDTRSIAWNLIQQLLRLPEYQMC